MIQPWLKRMPERLLADQLNCTLAQVRLMQDEINELRSALAGRDAEVAKLKAVNLEVINWHGQADARCAERDAEIERLMAELGDLPQAQADMLTTITAQRKVLEQALEALQWEHGGEPIPTFTAAAITTIQEVLSCSAQTP